MKEMDKNENIRKCKMFLNGNCVLFKSPCDHIGLPKCFGNKKEVERLTNEMIVNQLVGS